MQVFYYFIIKFKVQSVNLIDVIHIQDEAKRSLKFTNQTPKNGVSISCHLSDGQKSAITSFF